MASISMSDIYCNGTIFENDDEQLIYLTAFFSTTIHKQHMDI